MPAFVYFLECRDHSIYTGMTERLEYRLQEHDRGSYPDCYTFTRRPVKFLRAFEFPSRAQALEAEFKVKKWSRAKKLAFIADNHELVLFLSRNKKEQARLINKNSRPADERNRVEPDRVAHPMQNVKPESTG